MGKQILVLKEKLEKLTGQKVTLQNVDVELKSAVAIILGPGNKVLMGISQSEDDRNGKLCFVGGGIEKGETPYQAAKREAFEEAGVYVKCQPLPWLVFDEQPSIAFVLCKYIGGDLNPNEEFKNIGWYDYSTVSEDSWYKNNFNALMHFKN